MIEAARVLLIETQVRGTTGSMVRYANLVGRALNPVDECVPNLHVLRVCLCLPLTLPRWLPGGVCAWLNHLWLLVTGPARIRREAVDVVHLLDGSYAYLLRGIKHVPAIATVHDLIPLLNDSGHFGTARSSWPGLWLISRSLAGLRGCSRLLAVSNSTARDLFDRAAVPPQRVRVAPLALDPDFVRAAAKCHREAGPDPSDKDPFILHVGNNGQYKNRAGVVRIFSRIRDSRKAHLVMAGPPPPSSLRDLVHDLGLENDVHFVNDPDDAHVLDLYSSASLFLFPSLYEGFGWPPLEAMACGCPVVCSSEGSLAEIAGGAALMRPAADEEGLAKLCLLVLENRELAQTLCQKGREWVKQYNLERMRSDLLAVYSMVLPKVAL